MWVKLFFSHLNKSVRKNPLQSILSVLILALSFILSFSALNVKVWLEEETEARQTARYGTAAISVTLNGSSKTRFLQTASEIPCQDFYFSDIYG